MCMSGICGVEKRESDPLGLEFQTVVRHHADAGNQTCVLWESNKCLNLWANTSPSIWHLIHLCHCLLLTFAYPSSFCPHPSVLFLPTNSSHTHIRTHATHMHTCAHMHTHTITHAMHACTHTHTRAYTLTHAHSHNHTRTRVHIHSHMHVHTITHAMHACMHAHAHGHTHTHTHIQLFWDIFLKSGSSFLWPYGWAVEGRNMPSV